MARLVSILVLEEKESELVEPAFIKWLERSGDFKVLQFSKMDLLDSNNEKEEDEEDEQS